MKKNLRVVQINGFRGLFLTLFIVSCLIAGFIAFPAFLAMNLWNYLAIRTGSFSSINFVGGLLLWGIIAFSAFIFNKKKFIVSINSKQELSDAEVQEVLSKIKKHTIEPCNNFSNEINTRIENEEEIKEIQTTSNDK